MRTSFHVSLVIVACNLVAIARGESTYERDLKQIVDQRDKAIAAAAAPIIARAKADAAALMRKATQAGDLDAANKIKEFLGDTTPVVQGGPVKDLKKQLVGTRWKAVPSSPLRGGLAPVLTFTEKSVEPGSYKYEVESHNSVTIIFTGGDRQAMSLAPDGKRLKLAYGKAEFVYELDSK